MIRRIEALHHLHQECELLVYRNFGQPHVEYLSPNYDIEDKERDHQEAEDWYYQDQHRKLPWPFLLSVSASVFYRRFSAKGFFPWESLHKLPINTIFCVQLSQFEFPHA